MPCDFNALSQSTQPWGRLNFKQITAIQVSLMCNGLLGIAPPSTLNPITLQEQVNCFSALSEEQLMGIWTVLWSQWIAVIQAATGGGSQIVNFTNDPNTEGIVPANKNLAALAYPIGGGTLFQWVTPAGPWV